MICYNCNFNNEPNAVFCAKCGARLTANEKSDERTTVLKSEMSQQPDMNNANQYQGQANNGVYGDIYNRPANQMGGGFAPVAVNKPVAEPMKLNTAEAVQMSAKKSKGSVIYLVTSVLVMAVLVVGILGTYLYFNKQVKDLKNDKSELTASMTDAQNDIEALKQANDDNAADYQATIEAQNEQIEKYSKYDALLAYADTATGQGNQAFICSDQILHIPNGTATAVKVFYAGTGTITFTCDNQSVVYAAWAEGWENNVATLNIAASGIGSTTITFTSPEGIVLTLFVIVD